MKILNWEYCLYLTSLAGKEKQAFSKGGFKLLASLKWRCYLRKISITKSPLLLRSPIVSVISLVWIDDRDSSPRPYLALLHAEKELFNSMKVSLPSMNWTHKERRDSWVISRINLERNKQETKQGRKESKKCTCGSMLTKRKPQKK